MIKKYNKNNYMDLIGSAIEKAINSECVIVFYGSVLTERFNRTSDIDVAVYCKNGLKPDVYLKILDEIEKLPILREVDLVDLNRVEDDSLFDEILERGKVWKSSEELMKDLKNRLKDLRKL